jgi:hypothetical protein
MKKVLLSLSMLAAIMTANAQTDFGVGVGAYDDFSVVGNSTDNPSGEYSTPVVLNGVDYTAGIFWYVDGQYATTYTKVRANGEMAVNVAKGAEYSVIGFGFGDDNGADDGGNPFTIDISAAKTFSVDIKASSTVTVKVQFEDAAGKKAEATATKVEYSKTANGTYSTWTVNIAGGIGLDWSDATCPTGKPCAITGFDFSKVAKVNFLISGGTAYTGTVTFDNLKLGSTPNIGLGTTAAAANIASTKVFPNPATEAFTAEVSLKNNANVTIILSDMMGKQIATRSAANGSASFETASLAKGMYTVTYVLDGTPAKTELVVVK